MSKLLEQGIEAVRKLTAERQDMAGELLLAFDGKAPKYRLTSEQLEDLKMSIEEADRGEFVPKSEVAETWEKFARYT